MKKSRDVINSIISSRSISRPLSWICFVKNLKTSTLSTYSSMTVHKAMFWAEDEWSLSTTIAFGLLLLKRSRLLIGCNDCVESMFAWNRSACLLKADSYGNAPRSLRLTASMTCVAPSSDHPRSNDHVPLNMLFRNWTANRNRLT